VAPLDHRFLSPLNGRSSTTQPFDLSAANVRFHCARPITNSIDRFRGTLFPFIRQTITAMPYCQRRFAVARLMPNSQQIGFHCVRFARSQTSRASSFSSQRREARHG
jgi:hypothetical protein